MTALDAALVAVMETAVKPLAEEVRALRVEVESLRDGRADALLTVEEAAKVLGTTAAAVRKRIARGTLAAVRSGRAIRLRRGSLVSDGACR